MTNVAAALLISLVALVASSCDVRSDTAKREMEKFTSSPTPPILPIPTTTPVDPADIVNVDTSLDGDKITVSGHEQKQTVTCKKFNRVMVNGDDNTITIKGACSQIMINGDRNEITADAAMEIVLNGSENKVLYSRYVNGKLPSIVENQAGNVIEKTSTEAMTITPSQRKIVK